MARIWITDGSLVPFSDVHRLTVSHRAQFGLHASYKGLIDESVPIGSAVIRGDRFDDVLCAEAEWCLQFPEGIGSYLTGARGH